MKSVILLLLCISLINAINIDDRDDYAAVSLATMQTIQSDSVLLGSESNANVLWLYTTIPSVKLGKMSLYTAIEAELFSRDIVIPGSKVRSGVKQRYGIFTGLQLLKTEKHAISLYLSGGVASDFENLTSDAGYLQMIYDHRFYANEYITVGLGGMYSHQLGGPKRRSPVNLLPTLRLKAHERIRISINWDNLEMKYYVHDKFAIVGEGRYDMSYFHLGDMAYQIEEVSTGAGVDVKIADNFKLRSRILIPVSRTEQLWNDADEWVLADDDPTDSWCLKLTLSMVR